MSLAGSSMDLSEPGLQAEQAVPGLAPGLGGREGIAAGAEVRGARVAGRVRMVRGFGSRGWAVWASGEPNPAASPGARISRAGWLAGRSSVVSMLGPDF